VQYHLADTARKLLQQAYDVTVTVQAHTASVILDDERASLQPETYRFRRADLVFMY